MRLVVAGTLEISERIDQMALRIRRAVRRLLGMDELVRLAGAAQACRLVVSAECGMAAQSSC